MQLSRIRACALCTHTDESAEIIWNRAANAIYIFNDRGYRARLASVEGNRAEKRDGTRTGRTVESFVKGKGGEIYAEGRGARNRDGLSCPSFVKQV